MTRNILFLILLTTFGASVAMSAEPTPAADRSSRKSSNKVEREKPQAKTNVVPKNVPVPLAKGWNYVKGEWIHSDGYKYVKGQVIRTVAQTDKAPPKPPSKALLDSVKARPSPSPDPNSAAAKAAEKERNMRPRPAPQTGTHL